VEHPPGPPSGQAETEAPDKEEAARTRQEGKGGEGEDVAEEALLDSKGRLERRLDEGHVELRGGRAGVVCGGGGDGGKVRGQTRGVVVAAQDAGRLTAV